MNAGAHDVNTPMIPVPCVLVACFVDFQTNYDVIADFELLGSYWKSMENND